jgi:hypothetical protein
MGQPAREPYGHVTEHSNMKDSMPSMATSVVLIPMSDGRTNIYLLLDYFECLGSSHWEEPLVW